MLKKLIIVLIVVVFMSGLSQAQINSSWFVKGHGGIVYDKTNVDGITGLEFGRLVYKNIAIFGKYADINIADVNIENYNGKVAWYTHSPKDQTKINLYLVSGAGIVHNPLVSPTQDFSYSVGFGFLFPLANASPGFEIEALNANNKWYISPTVVLQIGLDF